MSISVNSQQGFTKFGPDPAYETLPLVFQQCLPPNQTSTDCDLNIVGSLAHGAGYCSDPAFADTTYCACVNAPITSAQCFFAPCANSAHAYQTVNMQNLSGSNCPKGTVCINIVDVGGSQNVVSGISQQCGIITNITNAIQANPFLALVAFLLVVALIWTFSSPAQSVENVDFQEDSLELSGL